MRWNRLTPSNLNGWTRFLKRLPPQWPSLVLTIVLFDAMVRIASLPGSRGVSFSQGHGNQSRTQMMLQENLEGRIPPVTTASTPPMRLPSGISPSAAMLSGSIYTSEESGTKEPSSATSSPHSGKHQRDAKTAPQMAVGLPPGRLSLSGAKETLKMQP